MIKSKVKDSQTFIKTIENGHYIKERDGRMANVSKIIESFLLEVLGDDEKVEINRNQLAKYFSCSPSQINYVLTTRFSLDRGYLIESQRGTGGFVTLIKVNDTRYHQLSEIIEEASKGNGISYHRANNIIDRMIRENLISDKQAEIIRTVLSDKSLLVPISIRDHLRANILKNIINTLLQGE